MSKIINADASRPVGGTLYVNQRLAAEAVNTLRLLFVRSQLNKSSREVE